jgi:hypothetical protein
MKGVTFCILIVGLFAIGAMAQPPASTPATSAGNVSRIIYFDVLPGKGNDNTNHIRMNQMPILEEQKKQGLILSYAFFGKPTTEGPGDWDLGLIVTYKNYADAIDFNSERGAKFDAIGLKHYGSAEVRTKANDAANSMRTVVRSYLVRGVTFNPMPK